MKKEVQKGEKEKGSPSVSQWKYGDQKPPNPYGGLKTENAIKHAVF